MTEFSFTDRDLRLAAAGARDAILAALPEPEACPADFSEGFHARMKPLLRQGEAWENHRRLRRRLIAALLALVLGAAAVAAFHPAVRAAVQKWFRETFSHSVVYRYTESAPPDAVLPEYTVGWLPEGYVLTEEYPYYDSYFAAFDSDTGDRIVISWYIMNRDTQSTFMYGDNVSYTCTDCTVGGKTAHYYEVMDPSRPNDLIWFDNETGVTFRISASLSQADMLRIAESFSQVSP